MRSGPALKPILISISKIEIRGEGDWASWRGDLVECFEHEMAFGGWNEKCN